MKKFRFIAAAVAVAVLICGCSKQASPSVKLDPDNPVSVTVWHYYNGAQQVAFDKLVEEFNSTVGKEKGIYVQGHSQGNVTQLEENVMSALNKEVGSNDAPEIFSSYADTAYEIEKKGYLADISKYLSENELSEYVDSYIEEGRIGAGGGLKIFPVAKSSELMFINKTDWDKFADATGADIAQISTCEGLAKVAEQYYNWTDLMTPEIKNDGKSLYGRDAMANLFIVGSMQLNTELFSVKNQKLELNINKDVMKRIWDSYYVPFVKGYFSAYGKFRSDDMKIGKIIAFTGSITSSMYFPDQVELETTSYPIDYYILPAPIFEGSNKIAVQQGAGMVVSKTTEEKEYASVLFLKWFTQAENNVWFSCSSSYLPVKEEAYSKELLDRVIEEKGLEVSTKTYDTLLAAYDLVNSYTMYTNKAFDGGSDTRKIVEYNLSDKATADRAAVVEKLAAGAELDAATSEFISEEAFEAWYIQLCEALEMAVKGK